MSDFKSSKPKPGWISQYKDQKDKESSASHATPLEIESYVSGAREVIGESQAKQRIGTEIVNYARAKRH